MRVLITVVLFLSLNAVSAWWKAHATWDNKESGETIPDIHTIDQTEPTDPGPFHELTTDELKTVQGFLVNHPKIQAAKSSNARLNSSYIYNVQLMLPKKEEVLNYLDKQGPKPKREAHVIMFRGDRDKPIVEECVCGPLPNISKCELLKQPSKRNPVEWTIRPIDSLELTNLKSEILKKVDLETEDILLESYGAKFTGCQEKEDCLTVSVSPVGSGAHGDLSQRLMWVTAAYNLRHSNLQTLDFAFLLNSNSTNVSEWQIQKVWYGGEVFNSLSDLVSQYRSNSITKTKVTKPVNVATLFSNLRLRGEPMPPKPQRPPTLVEPDGRRYSVRGKRVHYLGWSFSFIMSALSGPAVYDVRYKGERIVYEFALSEVASFHSGHAPSVQTLDDIGSSRMMGSRSRALIPGADCPETATLLRAAFLKESSEEPEVYDSAMCLFENNDGHAMQRHLSYTKDEGGFFGGTMDTQLTLRAAMDINGASVIYDLLFHANGIMHARTKTTGYAITSFFASSEKPYGHRIHDNILGNIHQDMINIKIDVDVNGQSNRYETLDIQRETVMSTAFPDKAYSQTRFNSSLKTTEKSAVYDFEFSQPKYHIVHNNEKRNQYGEKRAYRIDVRDMAINLLEKDQANEKSIPWARHQIVVTKRKEEEASSSSIYALLDSQNPVVDFSKYYEDDENIVDQDLMFWVTAGNHYIPRSEDIPNTATAGNHMSVFLSPYNYNDESPSAALRDAIYIRYKDPKDPSKGVQVDRMEQHRALRDTFGIVYQGTVPGGRPSLNSNGGHGRPRAILDIGDSLENRSARNVSETPHITGDITNAVSHQGKNGNSENQFVLPKPSLEDDVESNPDLVLESRKWKPSDV